MSSSEGPDEKIPVTVHAGKDSEIFVIDGGFNLKARGVGHLHRDLEPGLYKLKFREGPLIQEVHIVVEAGGDPLEHTSPPMLFASPAPLAHTGTTHEYQEEAAARLSREVHRRIAPGSQIFVFARTFSGPERSAAKKVRKPARGLTLHDPDGRLLVDLEHDAQGGPGPDPSAGCTVDLAPGAYRLRAQTERWGPLEQTIVASPGWQTQVFLGQTDDDGRMVPDLSGAAVFLVEMGAGFVPDAEAPRSSELARVALGERRVFLPRHQLLEMVSSGDINPMAAIYAAHAVAGAAQDDDRELLTAVTDRLRDMLGKHPDVEALSLFVEGSAGIGYRYETPPMLASSWSLVVSAATQRAELVPRGSLAAQVATALWGDGPWLIWLADRLQEEARRTSVPLGDAVSRIAELANVAPSEAGIPQAAVDLNDAEEALLSVVSPRQGPARAPAPPPLSMPLGSAEVPGASVAPPSFEVGVAARLGVPLASLEGVAATLLRKLEDQHDARARPEKNE